MRILRVSSRDEGSQQAATLFAELSAANPTKPVGLATGSTMSGVYRELENLGFIPECEIAFALDEYSGLGRDHPNSYFGELNEQFVQRIGFKGRLLVPGQEPYSDPEEFERAHLAQGPLAVQLLGLGSNGHIAFNEPGSSWDSVTRVVELHEATIRDNSRFFEYPATMPSYATTQGIATIKRASALLLLVFGESKLAALQAAFRNPGVNSPVSSLFDHPNLTLITDLELS